MLDFLRFLLENDFVVGIAKASGSSLGNFLAGLLGPLLGGLMG